MGSLLGGSGEDLEYIAFSPGTSQLSETEKGKLDALAHALVDRPGLRLETTGTADPEVDRHALAVNQFRKELLKRKFIQGPSSASMETAVERDVLTPEEESRLTAEWYAEKFGMPPKGAPAATKGRVDVLPPLEEMQSKLVGALQVGEATLRLLAKQRAQRIRDYLIQEGNIPGGRVFMVEPHLHSAAEGGFIRCPLGLTAD